MRKRSVVVLLVALWLAGPFAGCKSGPPRLGADLSPEVVAKIKRGMSEDEVEDRLGRPMKKTGMDEGRHMWTYRFMRVKQGDKTTYRAIPPEFENRYHGSVFVVFDGKGRVVSVAGGENQ
jgi:outer membrane protein assembly factor BamE (lipoprotein component of BamABCDE complex)